MSVLIDPDGAPSSNAAEQLGAQLRAAMLRGFAKSLGNQLAEVTLTAGPWLLHADGRVESIENEPGEGS